MSELQELMQKIRSFRDERNWKQLHTPPNQAAALAIKAGELQEVMLWKTDTQVESLLDSPEGKKDISAEIYEGPLLSSRMVFACRDTMVAAMRRFLGALTREQ